MSLELLSPLSDANREADARAFAALMRHVRETDGFRRSWRAAPCLNIFLYPHHGSPGAKVAFK